MNEPRAIWITGCGAMICLTFIYLYDMRELYLKMMEPGILLMGLKQADFASADMPKIAQASLDRCGSSFRMFELEASSLGCCWFSRLFRLVCTHSPMVLRSQRSCIADHSWLTRWAKLGGAALTIVLLSDESHPI